MFIFCICTQYLVAAPFALITASIRRGMEVIWLRHCWVGMEAQVSLTVAFSSSAFFALLFPGRVPRWRDYVSRLAWERLCILPEEQEEVSREEGSLGISA